MQGTVDWDEPLPADQYAEWEQWKNSLIHLENLRIPRTYIPGSLSDCKDKTVHVFSDASEKAISAVAYIKTSSSTGDKNLGFVVGKAKVAPLHGHSIPRLELCAAVLAVEVASSISDHLDLPIENFRFYTDSKVILGYICNQSKRFYTYLSNRVMFIRKVTRPEQWSYVTSEKNPADQGTRPMRPQSLQDSSWLLGPSFLLNDEQPCREIYQVIDPDADKEVRPDLSCFKTEIVVLSLGSHRFERFSEWKCLVETIARLQHIVQLFNGEHICSGWHLCCRSKMVDAYREAEKTIIKVVQQESYKKEFTCTVNNKPLPKDSPLLQLDPFIDEDGLMRVGGRINKSEVSVHERNPLIVPGCHHIAILLVRHHHELVKHQGRLFTASAVRNAGIWIQGCKRLIASLIHKCVKCRKLRGKLQFQKMANLPEDRFQPGPPFTYVGLDTFGPWSVVTRRTRGGSACSKRWAILFTCLTTRAIHIEVIEEMTSASFINAFKRFRAIRGSVKQIRSDRGSNFVGATDDLKIDIINVEDGEVKDFLYNSGITWIFNSPHSSHMGGVWERMIGVTRRILDSLMMEIPHGSLTHDVLTTFLAEASAIVNSRPLVPLSSDSSDPIPLSPSMLLTQKPDVVLGDLPIDHKSMYKAQWKRVQHLADLFWHRWRTQYLQTLQTRRKWHNNQPNIAHGDVVLLKDKNAVRNDWPMGRITNIFPSSDGKVRKVEVRVVLRDDPTSVYVRPVTEVVLLVSDS